jgi:hypothetical protein
MCTVTFIPAASARLITSNRDEQVSRASAQLPEVVSLSSGRMLFPIDGQAGGTWIASHENGNAMVLLNGAFERHKHEAPYRKSRGLIFLDIFNSAEPARNFEAINLDCIEPFTLVICEDEVLREARWDGRNKYLEAIDATVPHIWSSVTLYDESVRRQRAEWFEVWLKRHPDPKQEDIRRFHEFAGDGDEKTNLCMNRDGILQTVSITGITISEVKTEMHYRDLRAGLTSVHAWPLKLQQFH